MRTAPPASPPASTVQSPVAAKKLPAARTGERDDEYAELRTFLASIECSKYSVVLQDNEVTLGALLHFCEDDLKTLGIPLGPSIRIVRSLKTRAPEDGHGEVELEGSCETEQLWDRLRQSKHLRDGFEQYQHAATETSALQTRYSAEMEKLFAVVAAAQSITRSTMEDCDTSDIAAVRQSKDFCDIVSALANVDKELERGSQRLLSASDGGSSTLNAELRRATKSAASSKLEIATTADKLHARQNALNKDRNMRSVEEAMNASHPGREERPLKDETRLGSCIAWAPQFHPALSTLRDIFSSYSPRSRAAQPPRPRHLHRRASPTQRAVGLDAVEDTRGPHHIWGRGKAPKQQVPKQQPITDAKRRVSAWIEDASRHEATAEDVPPSSKASTAEDVPPSGKHKRLPDETLHRIIRVIGDAMRHHRVIFDHGMATTHGAFSAFDRDGNGRISCAEFSEAMRRLDIPLSDAQLRKVFGEFDLDGDDRIEYGEFAEELHKHGQAEKEELSQAFLEELFSRVDRNGDGSISRAELIKTARADAQVRELLQLPEHIREEQRAALEEVFQGMDVDDSRGVDLAEFVAFMRQRWPTS